MSVLRSTWAAALFSIAYVAALLLLLRQGFELSDALVEFAIFGIILPLIAFVATIRARRLALLVAATSGEVSLLVGYLLVLSAYVAIGPQLIDRLLPRATPQLHEIVNITRKLV